MLLQFANTTLAARYAFSTFVEAGKGGNPWDNISNQVFLGDDDFVQTHLNLLEAQTGGLSEIPKKQKRKAALSLAKYGELNETRNDAICAAYLSGGYTLKEVGDYFKLHYSRVSKIVAKRKT